MTIRIAMWSGPRNISTAMMRAFENRPDCAVSDEPFYGFFLAETGLDHPMRDAVIVSQPRDWRVVADAMAGPAPGAKPIWYQKHMAHHMLPGVGLDWTEACRNVFLIRKPERVLASYTAKRGQGTLEDIGFVQQAHIFDHIADRTGQVPLVIDSEEVLADPRAALRALCTGVGIAFSEAMLRWPAGRRDSDGVWAPVWYDAVERSTGFAPPGKAVSYDDLPAHVQRIADAAQPYHDRLARYCMTL